jgi:hypothetical protein
MGHFYGYTPLGEDQIN